MTNNNKVLNQEQNNTLTERNKELSNEFLTQEERKNITTIIECIRYTVRYYKENREDSKKLSIMGDDFSSVESYVCYEEKAGEIKKIFADIKKRVEDNEKELEKTEMLEQNVLTIMENLIEGIDYWEDIELREEVKFWEEEAEGHLKAIEVSERWNKNKEKELKKSRKMSEKWLVRRLIGLNRVKNWISEYNEKLHNIKIKELEGVVSDKTREVKEKTEKIGFLSGELEKSNNLVELLRKGSGEKDSRIEWLSRELEKTNTKLKETEDLLCLSNKPLPPLPEKKSEFQQLKIKVKSKFNHWAEKIKSQEQKFVARIEVRTK